MSNKSRTSLIAFAGGVLVIAIAAATYLTRSNNSQPAQSPEDTMATIRAALASEGAPSFGDPNASVHIVEFIDPACETCALFFPMVKQWIADVPGEIRLSIRHVAFHEGAEYTVKVLEASRKQGKYWETLEALLASQREWTRHHTVLPDQVGPAIASVGLDMDRLQADMNSTDVMVRMEQDRKDAMLLKVTKTPEYYVNGRPLPSFGAQQLANLVREELAKTRQAPR